MIRSVTLELMAVEDSISARVIAWAKCHGRHELPWQRPATPYRVWVSEIMLQQTQVAAVIPYYQRFMHHFPSLEALATASIDQVLAQWTGLGYYARARNLHAAARRIVDDFDSVFPTRFADVVGLPGIGRSTAGAILSLSMGQRYAILDGNVKRVLSRYAGVEGWPGTSSVQKKLWQIAETVLPDQAVVAAYNQAMMDLGASVCTRQPKCQCCPLRVDCVAFKEQRTAELPMPKPKRERPLRQALLAVLRDSQGQIFLERRPARGIWGGLWSPPLFTDRAALDQWLLMIGLSDAKQRALEAVVHGFSHFRMHIQPVLIEVQHIGLSVNEGNRGSWHQPAALTGGFAAPIKRLLAELPPASLQLSQPRERNVQHVAHRYLR